MRRTAWATARIVPTLSSRPHRSPTAISRAVVDRIVQIRKDRKRCADVIHAQLQREGIRIHLNTVKRTLHRQGLFRERSPYKKYHLSGERLRPEKPEILVQTDTVHVYINTRRRIYIFTIIDLYSRWAYAKASKLLNARLALEFVMEAQKRFNRTIQEDMQREINQYKTNLPVLNREIEKYLEYYNNQHLHMGIKLKTPAEVITSY